MMYYVTCKHGFRQKHLTSHALISLTEKIKQTIDKGNHTCGVFIDLKKTSDTVSHTILLQKLQYYGIRGYSTPVVEIISQREKTVCFSLLIIWLTP